MDIKTKLNKQTAITTDDDLVLDSTFDAIETHKFIDTAATMTSFISPYTSLLT